MKSFDKHFNIRNETNNLISVYRHNPPEHIKEYMPNWDFKFWMYNYSDDLKNIQHLAKTLEKLEPSIIKQYQPVHDSQTGLGNDTVTSRSHRYNMFRETDKTILYVQEIIKKEIKNFLIQTDSRVFDDINFDPHINCWFNVMPPGEQINVHTHNVTHPFISGHFTVQCEQSFTYYVVPYTKDKIEIPNRPGEGIIFPSYLEHGTSIHSGQQNRISIAWDLYYNKDDVLPAIFDNVEPINISN